MASIRVPCLICKKIFELHPQNPAYRKAKENKEARFTCPDCKDSIQREAESWTGIRREMLEDMDEKFFK